MVKSYKEWSLIDWVGLVGGVFALIAAAYGFYSYIESKTKDKSIYISIHDKYVHLGDNTLANVGGEVSPKVPIPGAKELENLLIYDKSEKSFGSYNGFPSEVIAITNHYEEQFKKNNFDAYKHVKLANGVSRMPNDYIGQSVDIGGGSILLWENDAGNFYYENAPVGFTKTINIYKHLADNLIEPNDIKVKKAYLHFYGSHSGRLSHQKENVNVIVNGVIHSLIFNSKGTRPEEVIKLELSEKIFQNITPRSTRFTFMVLPFQEQYPTPPKDSIFDSRGPAHFRDVEIWDLKLELLLD
jgi:hypothetical protein